MEPSPAHDILSYLLEHPNAQDTLEGVAEWWCLERSIQRRVNEVQDAMDDLVAKDFVIPKKGRDLIVRYRVNHNKLREIMDVLTTDETADAP